MIDFAILGKGIGVFSTESKLGLLASFIYNSPCIVGNVEIHVEWVTKGKEGHEIAEATDFTHFERDEKHIYIFDAYDPESRPPFCATIPEFLDILDKCKKQCSGSPGKIFIVRENNIINIYTQDYSFQDFHDIKFNENTKMGKTFELPEKEFLGGFHCCLQNKNKEKVEFTNLYSDEENVINADIKFADDFTINHALFPKDWTLKQTKERILESLKRVWSRKVEIEGSRLIVTGYPDEYLPLRTILDENYNILVSYPIFEKIKV